MNTFDNYFKNYYKMIAIDLSKQQELGADPKAIHQINFMGNVDKAAQTTMFFIIKNAKETIVDFSQGTVKVFCECCGRTCACSTILFCFNIVSV